VFVGGEWGEFSVLLIPYEFVLASGRESGQSFICATE